MFFRASSSSGSRRAEAMNHPAVAGCPSREQAAIALLNRTDLSAGMIGTFCDIYIPDSRSTASYGNAAHSARFRAVAEHPRLRGRVGLRGLALQAAECAPARVSADEIVAETIERFRMSRDKAADISAQALALWAPRPEGPVDPLSAAYHGGSRDPQVGWKRAFADVEDLSAFQVA